jgi:subtilisin family serine protease
MYPPVPRSESHTGAIVAAVLTGVWLVVVAVAGQSIMWLVTQVLLASGVDVPVQTWPIAAFAVVLVAGLPAVLLATIPRHAPTREAGRAWTVGAAVLAAGSALRTMPVTENVWLLLATAVLAGIGALIVRRKPQAPAQAETQTEPQAQTQTETQAETQAGPQASPQGEIQAPPQAGPQAPPQAGPQAPPQAGWPAAAAPPAAPQAGWPAAAAPPGHTPAATAPGWWLPPTQTPYGTTAWYPPAPPPKPLKPPAGPFPGALGWGIAAGILVLMPFLWVGAFGGWLETLFAVCAAAAIGALAASTMDYRFWTAYDHGTARRVLLGGLTGGTALALFAGGLGGNGAQVLLLCLLPPLGFAAAALKRAWPMIALAALGPLALVDPVEVNLLLMGMDVPYWVMIASLAALGLALLVGLVYALGIFKTPKPLAFGTAAALAIAAGLVYAGAGQPGFYGDQLFVVMREQAPLAGLPATTGLGPARDARVTAVYQRLVEHANRTQAALRADLDRWRLTYRPYYLVNAVLVEGGPEVRAWLQTRDDVDRVLLDQRLRALPARADGSTGDIDQPPSSPEWNLRMVGAPQAWSAGHTGKAIVVGSSDSGADGTHPALSANFRGGDDSWYDPWNHTSTPQDNGGHGTHTLATAVGRQNIGVAPDAQWVSCVNLDRNLGSPSLYLECLQFMLAPFPKGGNPFTDGRAARAPHVLTNSWGCPALEGCDLTVMRPATDALAAAGIAFVAAAGNTGPFCGSIDDPPAPDPSAFTVGAVDRNQRVATFSSRGEGSDSTKPDVVAPGQGILSAMPGNTYSILDGTSMATPHVAGVVALLWSAEPDLVGNLEGTYSRIRDTAAAVAGGDMCGGPADSGAGIVNAAQAIR